MKLVKGLVVTYAVTLLLTSIGVNAASLVLNETVLPLKQQVAAYHAAKDEQSYQYLYTNKSTDPTYLFGRAVQAALMGKDYMGNSCETDYVTLTGKAWKTLGNSQVNQVLGCGLTAVNGNGFLLLKTEKSYNNSTYYWGTWATTEKTYNLIIFS